MNVPEHVDLRDLVQAHFLDDLLAVAHLQHFARLADGEPVAGDIQRPEVVAHRHEAPYFVQPLRSLFQRPHSPTRPVEQDQLLGFVVGRRPGHRRRGFVWQADADERAPWALRAVGERRRQGPSLSQRAGIAHCGQRLFDQRVVYRHAHALLRLVVVEDGLVAHVARVGEDQRLTNSFSIRAGR